MLVLALAMPVAAQNHSADDMPASSGRVALYGLTPRSDVACLILADRTEIHLPPHLGPQLVGIVKPGDTVVVRGFRARAIHMMQAVSIINPSTGRTVADGVNGAATPSPAGAPHGLRRSCSPGRRSRSTATV